MVSHAAYLAQHPKARANQFKGEPIVEDYLMATKEAQKLPKGYEMTGQDVAKALKFT